MTANVAVIDAAPFESGTGLSPSADLQLEVPYRANQCHLKNATDHQWICVLRRNTLGTSPAVVLRAAACSHTQGAHSHLKSQTVAISNLAAMPGGSRRHCEHWSCNHCAYAELHAEYRHIWSNISKLQTLVMRHWDTSPTNLVWMRQELSFFFFLTTKLCAQGPGFSAFEGSSHTNRHTNTHVHALIAVSVITMPSLNTQGLYLG